MYIFPGYTSYMEEAGYVQLASDLYQSKVKLTEKDLIQEFHDLLYRGGCNDLSTPLTIFLHEQGLLQSPEEIKNALEETKQIIQNDLMLTLMPTDACNFRCPYCYENHNALTMSKETVEQIKKFISIQAPNSRRVNLSWFGGEPTLCKEIVLDICTFVQSIQKELGFIYTSNMTTNGYLLDLNAFCQYFNAGITFYQITLDGWSHDQTRPHVSGKGTLNTILTNLKDIASLSKQDYPFHIILRHNILDGDEDYKWYDHLYTLFGGDDRFTLAISPVCDWGGNTVKSLNLLHSKTLVTAHNEYASKLGFPVVGTEKKLLRDICSASFAHGFIFRASGKIEKCTIALDHPNNLVGNIIPGKGVVLNEEACRRWCTSEIQPKCLSCPDVLSCLNLTCRKGIIIDGRVDGKCICESVKLR